MKCIYFERIAFVLGLALVSSSAIKAQDFKNPLLIPPAESPSLFEVTIEESSHNFDPNGTLLNSTVSGLTAIDLDTALPTYCYNMKGSNAMSYLGPTFVWQYGDSARFAFTNNLPVKTTVHWHGLNVPAPMDGGPHQVIAANGGPWNARFPIIDSVQTIWYHTHLMNFTTDQVIRGLAGMIVVEDSVNDAVRPNLPHHYGVNDIPLVIQEKGFNVDTNFTPPKATSIIAGERPGNGIYTLMNGRVNTVHEVPAQVIRLRVLNGSPRKQFIFGISTQKEDPIFFETIYYIASGGGYLDVPRPMDSALVAVGDRKEFIVDFTGFANGDTLYMNNLFRGMPSDANYGKTPGNAFMAFVINNAITPYEPITTLPNTLKPYAVEDTNDIFLTRTKRLQNLGGNPPGGGHGGTWVINGTGMKMQHLNDTILVNKMEKWVVVNETDKTHPFHIHKVQFQVIEYQGKMGMGNDSTYHYQYQSGQPIPDDLVGYKDVQMVREGATMAFIARFDSFPATSIDFRDGFMYHCHILTHEDSSMMHQFTVVDSATYHAKDPSGEQETVVAMGDYRIYPNPANHSLTLTGLSNESGILTIRDLLGKTLYTERVEDFNGSLTLDVSSIPRGMVLVEWQNGNERFTQKILLTHD